MTRFNPNSPSTAGLEWKPAITQAVLLDSPSKCIGMSLTQSTAGAAIDNIYPKIGTIPIRGGLYFAEVFDNETGVIGAVTELEAVPNEDVSGVGASPGQWLTGAGSASNLFQAIDEGIASATFTPTSDFILQQFPGPYTTPYVSRMNTGSLSLTGKRILYVKLVIKGNTSVAYSYGLNIGGTDYTVNEVGIDFGVDREHTWYYNPKTGLPWRIADVQAFDTTDEWFVNGAGNQLAVGAASLFVGVCTENRLAFGALDDRTSTLTADSLASIAVLTPTSGAWTKDGSGRHLYTLRRGNDIGSLAIPTLSDGAAPPDVATGFLPTINQSTGAITVMGSSLPAVFAMRIGSTNRIDTQPYAVPVAALVYTGVTARQEITAPASSSYGFFQFLAYPNSATADLLVKIKKVSDNSQVGSTLTVTAASVLALRPAQSGAFWRSVADRIVTLGVLVSGTQYYLEFSSTAPGTTTDYWSVLALDAVTTAQAIAGFGGSTDAATINGGAEDARYDVAATIATVPTAPTGGSASISEQSVSVSCGCDVRTIQFAQLSWSTTSLSAVFGFYELRRSSDGGASWETIAYLLSEVLSTFSDYEGRRSIASTYQVRVVRSDGSASDWLTLGSVTPVAENCEWIFVTNGDQLKNLAYNYPPGVTYQNLQADATTFEAIYGRDYQIAFDPSERDGVRFSLPIHVAFGDINTIGGIAEFNDVRALFESLTVPYVCVLDQRGNRFIAKVQVPAMDHATVESYYKASIIVTELAAAGPPLRYTT